ncbi:MAG: hypothetical protein O3A63_12090 [Proteobacteria bacterium]|nr:hypothetical protein [Pseudomonadota bacterium]
MPKSPMVLGAVVFPGFEMLDLFGPLEMFSGLGQAQIKICVIAEQIGPVPAAIFADTWVEEARWVDDGPVVTSSGVSAGMDMALALIERLFDTETAQRIAIQTEYTRHTDADRDPFVAHLNAMV